MTFEKISLIIIYKLICYLTKNFVFRRFHEKVAIVPGYMISWLFLYLAVPWMSAVWFVVVDTFLVLYMRDSALMFLNVLLKNKSIIQWQADGVKIAKARQKKNMSIICPLGAFLKVKDYEETETLSEEVPALDEEA